MTEQLHHPLRVVVPGQVARAQQVARGLAQPLPQIRVVGKADDGFRESVGVAGIEQQAGFAVGQNFLDIGRRRCE